MKKIMSLMLGLTLVLGTAVAFADDKPADKTATTDKKAKKKSTKKADEKKDAAATK